MIQKKIQISESLQGLMSQMDDNQQQIVAGMFKHYMEQFLELRTIHNAESVAHAIHNQIDEMMDESIKEDGDGISCGKGCAFCCFQQVDISDDEAQLILGHTKENNIEIDFDTLKKQSEALDYMSLKPKDRKCVFLDNDMSCSIYEHRPSACRKLVVKSDKELCDTIKNEGAKVERLVSLEAEVVTSASLNIRESGVMGKMILNAKKD